MEGTWKQINAVVTPVMAYMVAVALGGSGFIAAFVAGIVFRAVAGGQAEATTHLAEESGELLNAVTFLLFGAVLLGPALGDLDWRLVAYAVLSLTVVRLLPVALAMVGTGMRRVTVGFLGWFGPRGLASIVFVLLLLEETDLPQRSLLLAAVTCDGRPVGVRPRPDRLAGRQPLRRLVRRPRPGPPGHARERPRPRAARPRPRPPQRRLSRTRTDRTDRQEGRFVVL